MMRKMIVTLLVTPLLLTNCVKESDTREKGCEENTEIRVKIEVEALEASKGPISDTFSVGFPIGIYGKYEKWLEGNANCINNDSAMVSHSVEHEAIFSCGPYYYPSDGSDVNIYAFAPHAQETTAAQLEKAPVVTHTITGQEDVMWGVSTGYHIKYSTTVQPPLKLKHKLAQLQFTLKSGESYPKSGNRVVSLAVKAQPTTVKMDVESGLCVFSGSADMQALSPANQAAGIEITAAGTNTYSPILTIPDDTPTPYMVDIMVKSAQGSKGTSDTTIAYRDIPVNLAAKPGNAYAITIVFDLKSIATFINVAGWTSGSSGTVEVE